MKAIIDADIERLWDALMWLDTRNPEDTAAMEKKFHFNLMLREIYESNH